MDTNETPGPPTPSSNENSTKPPGDLLVLEPLKAKSVDPSEKENPPAEVNNNTILTSKSEITETEGGSLKVTEAEMENPKVGSESTKKELKDIVKPMFVASSSEEFYGSGGDLRTMKTGDEKPSPLKNFIGSLYMNSRANDNSAMNSRNNNNNNNNNIDDRTNLIPISDSKPYTQAGHTRYWNWKREQRTNFRNFGDGEERRRFPWKRITYICVLLVLGVTCAILALMKICGGADWMNTATFSVIMMGTCMLLPPGLYYGRILLCICFCKEYSLWDVPAGPFG